MFARKGDQDAKEAQAREKELFEEFARLKMEREWLKRSWPAQPLRNVAA